MMTQIIKERVFQKFYLPLMVQILQWMRQQDAIEIAKNNKSQLIILHVIDLYKYPYLLSSTILAPTFGSQKYAEEKKKAEEWMNTIKEKFKQGNNSDVNVQNIKTEVVDGKISVAVYYRGIRRI